MEKMSTAEAKKMTGNSGAALRKGYADVKGACIVPPEVRYLLGRHMIRGWLYRFEIVIRREGKDENI